MNRNGMIIISQVELMDALYLMKREDIIARAKFAQIGIVYQVV